jgi:hypothetical protein
MPQSIQKLEPLTVALLEAVSGKADAYCSA